MLKTIIILLPFVLIALFWAMAARERRLANDPSRKSFFQRNGAVISTYLLVAVAFWAIMMIVLPQLYMVDYSFHPKLTPAEQGGPKDVYTLANYRFFLYGPQIGDEVSWNKPHLKAFGVTILASLPAGSTVAVCGSKPTWAVSPWAGMRPAASRPIVRVISFFVGPLRKMWLMLPSKATLSTGAAIDESAPPSVSLNDSGRTNRIASSPTFRPMSVASLATRSIRQP